MRLFHHDMIVMVPKLFLATLCENRIKQIRDPMKTLHHGPQCKQAYDKFSERCKTVSPHPQNQKALKLQKTKPCNLRGIGSMGVTPATAIRLHSSRKMCCQHSIFVPNS